MKELKTDVLIVGAGPTGLMAACQLARFGINLIIIDKKEGPTRESRAIAVTARSIEIYDQIGLAERAIEEGAFIKNFSIYIGGKEKVAIPIKDIGKGQTDFPYLLAFEQSKNEELLYEFIRKSGREVLWKTELLTLDSEKELIKVSVQNTTSKENLLISARYLIACDGAKSPVRHQLNFSFKGGTYENKFFVADTVVDWGIEPQKILGAPTRKNFALFFPMHGEKHYRVLGSMPKEFLNVENINFSHLEELIKKTIQVPLTFKEVNWFSIYNLHHRAVDTFSKGSVFLAGDAAHIHSPAGGQGMNTGLQDAYNLAWKLALVVKGIANEKLLETYNEERLPFAKWLLKFTDRAFSIMTSSNLLISLFRKYIVSHLLRFLFQVKKMRKKMFRTVSQIGFSYFDCSLSETKTDQKLQFQSGDRFPYLLNEKGKSIYSLMKEPGFFIVKIGGEKINSELEKFISSKNVLIKTIHLLLTSEWKSLGVKEELYILVRPDLYIGLICDKDPAANIKKYFSEKLLIR